ncbi:TonB-dependent siderophore receptor [Aliarcobacter lanthieri]|uniref:TonB-dependent siderophore receptor n=1 Tax=Aliarcobacter lanthieri TaxID=1355374 RepID=UPI003AA7F6C3
MEQLKAKFITSASAILLCSALLAQEAYTIKNMSLKQALEKISKESKLSFIVDESLIDGKKATNIENVQDLKEALTKVLEGSGLNATIENNTIIIKEIPSYKIINGTYILDDVSVKSALGSTTEGSNSYTTGSMRTATKLDLSIRETPQSVKVLTREYLDDANINTYQELLNNVTGVSTNRWDERQFPTARGFALDYYLFDGVPSTMGRSDSDPDLVIYDRVEIVKGANGLMTGAGNPAVGINMIRKHANSKVFKGDINLSAGSWDNYSSSLDIQTPLNNDGSIRARLVAKYQDSKSFMDMYKKTNDIFYGVVDMDLTDTTQLSLGASYQKLDRSGVRMDGLPAFYTDGTRATFDRKKAITSDWTYYDNEIRNIYANATQYLYDDISLNLSYTNREVTRDSAVLYFTGKVDKNTNLGNVSLWTWSDDEKEKEDNFDIYASIPFELGGLEHEIVTGFMYNKNKIAEYYAGSPVLSSSILDMNNINIPLASPINNPNRIYLTGDETIQTGTYFAGKFSLMEDLKLIAGLRVSDWKFRTENGNGNREFQNELTPYAGLVYDIDEHHSIYASYTDIFKPQSSKDKTNKYLDPIVGKNYETGIKGEYFDKRLNAALSIFRVEQDGVGQIDDSGRNIITGEIAYKSAKGVVSKGVEFEMDGEITDNWNLSFGIANFEAKDAQDEKFNTTSSRTTANLFTKYKINKDLSIGGGLNYKSKFYTGSGATQITQDEYIIANAMASYDITKDLKLQLNINNLFDKKYYENVGTNRMVYGEPRSFAVNMRYSF